MLKGTKAAYGRQRSPIPRAQPLHSPRTRKKWHLARRARGLSSLHRRQGRLVSRGCSDGFLDKDPSSYCSLQLPDLIKPSLPVGLAEAAPSCLLTDYSIKDEHYITLIQELLRLS